MYEFIHYAFHTFTSPDDGHSKVVEHFGTRRSEKRMKHKQNQINTIQYFYNLNQLLTIEGEHETK